MITKEMIKDACDKKLIVIGADFGGVKITINEDDIYLGEGEEYENMTLENYMDEIPYSQIVEDIFQALESMRTSPYSFPKYDYAQYEAYLNEQMKENNSMTMIVKKNEYKVSVGSKIKLVNKMGMFTNIGEVCEVVSVDDDMIGFKFGGGMHLGMMSHDELDKYFEILPPAPTVTQEYIDEILENSDFEVTTVYDKCTVVSCRLPNGFIIVESSACVDSDNYNEDIGENICRERIESKLWELEGYALQKKLYEQENER